MSNQVQRQLSLHGDGLEKDKVVSATPVATINRHDSTTSNGDDDQSSSSGVKKPVAGRKVEKSLMINTNNEAEVVASLFDPGLLESIRRLFKENKRTGDKELSIKEFVEVLSKFIPLEICNFMYQRIDVNDDGFIDFSEFVNYLITSEKRYNGKQLASEGNASKVVIRATQDAASLSNHKEMVDHICCSIKPIPMCITASRDGKMIIWNAVTLEKMTDVQHMNKNAVYREILVAELSSVDKAQLLSHSVAVQDSLVTLITCMCALPDTGHICVGSVDNSLTLYELGTQDICGRMTTLKEFPTAVTAFSIPRRLDGINSLRDLYIVFGDNKGQVFVLSLGAEFSGESDGGAKKRNRGIFQSAAEIARCRPIHTGWINQLLFVSDLNSLVSISSDGLIHIMFLVTLGTMSDATTTSAMTSNTATGINKTTSINISSSSSNSGSGSNVVAIQRTFDKHRNAKKGAVSLAWSSIGRYFVSAAEREVIIWDPYTMAELFNVSGLHCPVVKLSLADSRFRLFIALVDKTILVYHTVTYEYLERIYDYNCYRPYNLLTAMHYFEPMETLYTVGNRVTAWEVIRNIRNEDQDPEDDISAVLFNTLFRIILIVTTFGSVKGYFVETGVIACSFTVTLFDPATEDTSKSTPYSDRKVSVVKSAAFDKHHRRLIIITHTNSIQLWNFNTGERLTTISFLPVARADDASKARHNKNPESFESAPQSFGPDQIITHVSYEIILIGAIKRPKKVMLLGTESGKAFCLLETEGGIDGTPASYLTRNDLESSSLKGRGRARGNDSSSTSSIHTVGVLWSLLVTGSDKNTVLAYADGRCMVWDLERSTMLMALNTEASATGPILLGMRRKGEKIPVVGGITSTAGGDDSSETSQKRSAARPLKTAVTVAVATIRLGDRIEEGEDEEEDEDREKDARDDDASANENSSVGSDGTRRNNKITAVENTLAPRRPSGEKGIGLTRKTLLLQSTKPPAAAAAAANVATNAATAANDEISRMMSFVSDRASNRNTVVIDLPARPEPVSVPVPVSVPAPVNKSKGNNNNSSPIAGASYKKQKSVYLAPGDLDMEPLRRTVGRRKSSSGSKKPPSLKRRESSGGSGLEREASFFGESHPLASYDSAATRKNRFSDSVRKFGFTARQDPESEEPSYPVGKMTSSLIRMALCPNSNQSGDINSNSNKLSLLTNPYSLSYSEERQVEDLSVALNLRKDDPLIEFVTQSRFGSRALKVPAIFSSDNAENEVDYPAGDSQVKRELDSLKMLSNSNSSNHNNNNNSRSYIKNSSSNNSINITNKSGSNIDHAISNKRFIVDSAVILSNPKILIGACSDKLIRFWDLAMTSENLSTADKSNYSQQAAANANANANVSAGHVLCSCKYFKDSGVDKGKPGRSGRGSDQRGTFVVEETLKILRLSTDENLLIGAYEHGVVRVWNIQRHTFNNIKMILRKRAAASALEAGTSGVATAPAIVDSNLIILGLSVSPLMLLHEFIAQDAPIIAAFFVPPLVQASATDTVEGSGKEGGRRQANKDSQGKPSNNITSTLDDDEDLQGFVVTASLEQFICVHSITGILVGNFGLSSWILDVPSTWYKKLVAVTTTATGKSKSATSFSSSSSSGPTTANAGGIASPSKPSGPKRSKLLDDSTRRPSITTLTRQLAILSNGSTNVSSSNELNSYVEKFNDDIFKRKPGSDAADKFFRKISEVHPIDPIIRPVIRKDF